MSETSSKYAKRLEQLEAFRQQKALEKSARADRIKKRVQELQDKRRQTIAQIRLDIGINQEKRKPTTGISGHYHKPENAQDKKLVYTLSKHNANKLTSRAKQAAVHLKEGVKKLTNVSQKMHELPLAVENERVNTRRLTMTLLESSLVKPSDEVFAGELKENKNLHQTHQSSVVSTRKTEPLPLSALSLNIGEVNSASDVEKEGSVSLAKGSSLKKRAPAASASDPVAKKPKIEATKRNIPDQHKTTSLTREQQLQIWRQQRQQKVSAEQKKVVQATVIDRRKTMPASTKTTLLRSAVKSGNVRVREDNAAASYPDMSKTKPSQLVGRPVSKAPAQASVKQATRSLHQPANKLVPISEQQYCGLARGTEKHLRSKPVVSTVRRSSLGHKPVNTKLHEQRRSCVPSGVNKVTAGNGDAIKGPQVSTPFSHRRSTAVVSSTLNTPSFSCIPRRKTVSFLTPTSAKHTPKPSQTPALTEEMCLREKLNKWLAAKGKTPSRYRHLMCFGLHSRGHNHRQPTAPDSCTRKPNNSNVTVPQLNLDVSMDVMEASTAVAQTDTAEESVSVTEQIVNMIKECSILLHSGFPAGHLMTWLDEISVSLPPALQLPSFWVFKAKVALKVNGDDYHAALRVLDEANTRGVQPSEEITEARSAFEQLLDKRRSNLSHNTSSNRLASEVQPENAFSSSAVKLCVRRVNDPITPFKTVLTPVRRSTRKSCSMLPPALRDHDVIVESTEEIAPDVCATMTFKENMALNLDWRYIEVQPNSSTIA